MRLISFVTCLLSLVLTLDAIGSSKPRKRCVVLDADNTLFDKRPTTIAAARSFARRFNEPRLANLRLTDARWDGFTTARAAGLDTPSAFRFHRYWDRYFWTPAKLLEHDKPIKKLVAMAEAAKDAGHEVFYVTGRWSSYRDTTIAQLEKHGLPNADRRHVFCRPPSMKTNAFKIAAMKTIRRRHDVLWFASDTNADIEAIQRSSSVPCILVDMPIKPQHQPPLWRQPTATIKIP